MPHSVSPEPAPTQNNDAEMGGVAVSRDPSQPSDGEVAPSQVPDRDVAPSKVPDGDVSPSHLVDGDVAPSQPPDGDVAPIQPPDGDVAMDDADAAPAAVSKPEPSGGVKLEDLFADDESDDEFPSSRPQDTPASSSADEASSPPPCAAPSFHATPQDAAKVLLVMWRLSRLQTPGSCAASTSVCSRGAISSSG